MMREMYGNLFDSRSRKPVTMWSMPKVNEVEAIAFFRQHFPTVPVIVMKGQPDVKGRLTS
jgi:hypothetical protein